MTPEIKMYMLGSGMPIMVCEERNDKNEVLWSHPMYVIAQQAGINFTLMNNPHLSKNMTAFPNLSHILYTMNPTEQMLDNYQKAVEKIKMSLAGLVSTGPKIIMPN